MIFNNDNLVKNLPDAYAKSKKSNNYKLLLLEKERSDRIRAEIKDFEDYIDIHTAFGKTLDMYGDMVGQARGVATDEQYRTMILSKIMQNLSNGTYPSVINAICHIFDCQPSDIWIVETENPCEVSVQKMPLTLILASGFTTTQTTQIIKRLLPVGVVVSSFLFDGTFEFSDRHDEYDEERGFADDEGTIGGFLGMLYGTDTEAELPI